MDDLFGEIRPVEADRIIEFRDPSLWSDFLRDSVERGLSAQEAINELSLQVREDILAYAHGDSSMLEQVIESVRTVSGPAFMRYLGRSEPLNIT